jgi:hypothetical protein
MEEFALEQAAVVKIIEERHGRMTAVMLARRLVVNVDAAGTEGYATRVDLNEVTGRSSVPSIFIGRESSGRLGLNLRHDS